MTKSSKGIYLNTHSQYVWMQLVNVLFFVQTHGSSHCTFQPEHIKSRKLICVGNIESVKHSKTFYVFNKSLCSYKIFNFCINVCIALTYLMLLVSTNVVKSI